MALLRIAPRVWFACFREKDDYDKFMFPEKEKLKITVKDLLEDEVDKKYYLTEKQLKKFIKYNDIVHPTLCSIGKSDVALIPEDLKIARFRYDEGLKFVKNKISPTINAGAEGYDYFLKKQNKQWRRLTPKECFRLMGFFNDEIKFGDLKDSKLYFLAGNGWDINVASKIFKQMFKGNSNEQQLLTREW